MGTQLKGRGAGVKFLHALLEDALAECVTWPLFRDENGYGRVGYNGDLLWAHRLMCIFAKGEPPAPEYEAAHSCGNGKGGCVNPRHLSWQTKSRNQKDRASHGTKAAGTYKRPSRRKLTWDDVLAIRACAGQETQHVTASRYGISDATVRDIRSGKSWANGPETWKELTPDEVREIRALAGYLPYEEIGRMFGVSAKTARKIIAGPPSLPSSAPQGTSSSWRSLGVSPWERCGSFPL